MTKTRNTTSKKARNTNISGKNIHSSIGRNKEIKTDTKVVKKGLISRIWDFTISMFFNNSNVQDDEVDEADDEAQKREAERLKDTFPFSKLISINDNGRCDDVDKVCYVMHNGEEYVFFIFGDSPSQIKIIDPEFGEYNYFNMGVAGRFKFTEGKASPDIIDKSIFFDINAGKPECDILSKRMNLSAAHK